MERTITVAEIRPPRQSGWSSSAKTTDGHYIGFKADKLALEVGKTYRLLVEEREKGGKTFVDAMRIVEEVLPKANGAAIPTGNIAPWWMPFVSNTVAHAIQAGCIKEPADIKQWAAAARQTAMEIEAEAQDDGREF
jgi:hypothetical protein